MLRIVPRHLRRKSCPNWVTVHLGDSRLLKETTTSTAHLDVCFEGHQGKGARD